MKIWPGSYEVTERSLLYTIEIAVTGELVSTCSRSASVGRVALVTDEWIPLQRSLSDETTISSLHFAGVSGGVLEDFCKMSELQKDREICQLHQSLQSRTPCWLA